MQISSWARLSLLLLLLLVLPVITHAQVRLFNPQNCAQQLGIPCEGNIFAYVIVIVNIFLSLVALGAVVVIIYAGVKYIMAVGDEQAAGEAKKIILYAVIGLIVVGLSAAIVNFVVLAIQGTVIS